MQQETVQVYSVSRTHEVHLSPALKRLPVYLTSMGTAIYFLPLL